jgi:two-component system copper resistance phosphate regulon response regulator CusR
MKVLVLEDDTVLRAAVARALRDSGAAVDESGTLAEADERLRVNEYDAVVLDRGLPDGDAADLVRSLREEGWDTPALFLTALDEVRDRVGGLDAGADDYVAKPFSTAELLARVRALARRSGTVDAPTAVLGDLVVDPAAMRVTRAEREVLLTAKEFSLLLHLVRNAGRVVSRTELIEHCWDEYADPMSNVVDVRIRLLRRKLGQPAQIHTVRGAGYVAEVRE